MDQRLFFQHWALDLFSCFCIGFSASPRTTHILLESWLRENRWCSYNKANCSGQTCAGNTFLNMTWKKTCGSMQKRRTCQKFKSRGSNAVETSASLKRMASRSEERRV